MLNSFFISKVRVKMLRQYLLNPEETHHVRGLVRLLDEEINAVRRELKNLEEVGLLKSLARGNKLEYTINPEFPILRDLISMFRKNEPEVKEIRKRLLSINGVTTALITDNFFSGKHENDTDVDLFIVAEAGVQQINAMIKDLEIVLKRELRVGAIKTGDVPFYFKKRDPILLNTLSKDTIELIGKSSDLIREN